MNGETILILANAEWDWANRVNCHHLAERLARDNRVLFVDTIGGRTPAPREFTKIARRLRRIASGVRRINAGLTVLSPFVLPVYGNDAIRALNTALLAWQIRRALPGLTRPILWLFLPSLVGLVGRFGEKLVVYHCIDQHAANPNVPARQVAAWEQQLLQTADVVFASSSTLFEAKRAFNANTFYLPNVADTEHFARACRVADDLQEIPRPIAGFVGNITAYKLDFDLLAAVAQAKPEWSFVLIGPIGRGDPSTKISNLQTLTNVHFLGERPYADLPRYVKGFDACLIPFKQNDSTRGSLPMKFFEYLAAGKPVVATDLPTLAEFREFFYPAASAAEFSAALDVALKEDATCAAQRVEIARRYSWDARMVEIERILDGRPSRFPKPRRSELQTALKRLLDIVIASVLLVVLSPLLLLIALAIRVSSGSPILFEWNVVGQNGRPFKSNKFRTMVTGADRIKQQLVAQNEMRGPVFKMKGDPRVTPVGRILRKYSLDELPQLWSVLKGDMSMVGPRPPLRYEYEQFTERQKRKLAVKPGMTSLWHVSGKPSDFEEWLRLDFEYIDRWSLRLDFEILIKTAVVVLRGKNY
ncbi:MAG: sugar transferase [Chloroflexi bacterium]|nr:sugar transferase [Chloroflexota bacterium]